MEPKFKVGDKVIAVKGNFSSIKKGIPYIVDSIDGENFGLKDIQNSKLLYGFDMFELESIYNSPLNQALR